MSKLISLRRPTAPLAPAKAALVPVRPAIKEYLLYQKPRMTIGSLRVYRQRLYVFADYLESHHIGLDQVDWKTVDSFLDHLRTTHKPTKKAAAELSQSTINGFYVNVKCFLNWCLKDKTIYGDVLDPSAVRQITPPPRDQVITPTFTDADIRALLEACKGEQNAYLCARNQTIIFVLVGTGIRVGELVGLKIADVHTDDEPHLLVFGKGHKERRVPLGGITQRKLTRFLSDWRADAAPSEHIFVTDRHYGRTQMPRALTVPGVQQVIESLGDRAAITGKRCSPHTFRHTFAARFIRDGGQIYHLQRVLGHQNTVTTETYLRSLGCAWNLNDLVAGIMR